MASREDAAPMSAGEGAAARGALASPAAGRVAAWLLLHRVDIVVVTGLTLLAALLRLWDLGTVPLGMHGDEAWTGLDARRVLRDGWIGVYVDSALGQPAGPVYFTALLFRFLPETTLTLRFSMALFGIATIPLAYAAFSLMFNRTVGVFGALLLSVMTWHLQLGRTGFMVITWPFIEVAALLALWVAFRRRAAWPFLVAGALTGLGLYTYNAYLLFVPVAFVPPVWWVLVDGGAPERMGRAAALALLFGVAALVMALPLAQYAATHRAIYEHHQLVVGVTHTGQWQDAGPLARVDILWDRAREWHNGLFFGGRPDLGDGLSEHGFPPVDPLVYAFALVGLGAAVWNIRRKEYAVCVAAAAIMPWGALLTVDDGLFRRTFGLAPFIALLAAIPLAWLWEALRTRRGAMALAGMAVLAAVPAYTGARAVHDYFGPAQDTYAMRFVYPYQVDAAARWIDGLPGGTYVYFYSDRWSIDYETVRFLAPHAAGEDRSFEFRLHRLAPDHGGLRLDIDRPGPVAFVMLGEYEPEMEIVRHAHPGGKTVESRRGEEVLFRAYVVDESGDEAVRAVPPGATAGER